MGMYESKLIDVYSHTLAMSNQHPVLKERTETLKRFGTKPYMEYSILMPCAGAKCEEKLGKVSVTAETTLECAKRMTTENSDKKVCMLNFASSVNPGGMWSKGSKAQESNLCYASNLFNSLNSVFDPVYLYNRGDIHSGLYTDNIIYSRNVTVFKEEMDNYEYRMLDENEWWYVDCMSVAAVNCGRATKDKIKAEEIANAMRARIRRLIRVAVEENVDILILGAFGCGVFKCNPYTVAELFKECLLDLERYKNFKEVVFAIPKGLDSNHDIFSKVLLES